MSNRGVIVAAVLVLVLVLVMAVWFLSLPTAVSVPEPTDAPSLRPVGPTVSAPAPAEPMRADAGVPLDEEERTELFELMQHLAPDLAPVACDVPESMSGHFRLRTVGPMGSGRVPWLRNEGGQLFATVPSISGRERLLHDGNTVGWLAWGDGQCTVSAAEFTQISGRLLDGDSPVVDGIIRGCERGTVLRSDAEGRFSFRLAKGQQCQPVVGQRVDARLWFYLPDRLGPTEVDTLDVTWRGAGPPDDRTLLQPDGTVNVSQLRAMRGVMADKLDPVASDLANLPPHMRALASEWTRMAAEDRSRVLEPLDELLDSDATVERFEDFVLLGDAMF